MRIDWSKLKTSVTERCSICGIRVEPQPITAYWYYTLCHRCFTEVLGLRSEEYDLLHGTSKLHGTGVEQDGGVSGERRALAAQTVHCVSTPH